MLGDSIAQIRHAQRPQQRKITRRQIPRLGDSDILSIRDANRSIVDRAAREARQEDKRLAKGWKKRHGYSPQPLPSWQTTAPLDSADPELSDGYILGAET